MTIAKQYGRGALTAGRAAEECGVSLWEMLEYLRAHQIPSPYDLRELEHDLGVVARRLRSKEEGLKYLCSRPG